MAVDPKAEAVLALHRFGFGPRVGAVAAIAGDPRGALHAELNRPGAGRIHDGDLLASGPAGRATFAFGQERQQARRAELEARKRAEVLPGTPPGPAGPRDGNPSAMAGEQPAAKPRPEPPLPQKIFLAEAKARVEAALGGEIGFVERLVWFWSNHFCISADKSALVRSMAGAYEREAIRPHVLGRFADMLRAVETHPAMLFYLDNVRSFGPSSIAGVNQRRGLNENLAREILELHTLGV